VRVCAHFYTRKRGTKVMIQMGNKIGDIFTVTLERSLKRKEYAEHVLSLSFNNSIK